MHVLFRLTAIVLLLAIQQTQAQLPSGSGTSSSSYPVYIYIKTPYIISTVTWGKPVFIYSGMNNIVNQYTVTAFEQAYPTSRLRLMRQVYKMDVSDTALPAELVSNYPEFFTGWELFPETQGFPFYTPNDFPNISGARNTGYLTYINAENAWNYTKGSSSIVIGMHDWDLDTTHTDLAGKLDTFQNTGYVWGLADGHGTRVAGLIAAETHNNPINIAPYGYYPSIGFNCKLDYVGCVMPPNMPVASNIEVMCPGFLETSQRGRRVINLSGGNVGGDTLFSHYLTNPTSLAFVNMENLYQEIYENGTLFVAAAGNGYSQNAAWHSGWYNYPASLDYVFSVSGVGWKHPYGSSATTNVAGLHEEIRGDSMSTQTHNSRVDLLAPSFDIGGLEWYNSFSEGIGAKGTSLAAPLVSGTAGLILSADSCFTPYQLEYILKESANDSILLRPENQKYAGKLGAGALNAGNALAQVTANKFNPFSPYNCNNLNTATLFIEGVDFNTLCVPGRSSNGVKPKLTPVIRNGQAPYTARWEPLDKLGNSCRLNAYNVFSPQIDSAIEFALGGSYFVYRLTVTDNSSVPKTATRIIEMALTSGELTSKQFELTGRDSYMDMVLEEPNLMDSLDRRDNNFYMSPDLWNRQHAAYNPEHQNAEYVATDSNYAFVRVRNVGCKKYNSATAAHYLKLYWTVASTGENWKNDWDGTSNVPGGPPVGGMLTSGLGIPIKDLEPGDTVIIRKGWRPMDPVDYGTSDLNVCLLARIVNAVDGGLTHAEVTGPVITNVRNNNNIFTRNLWVKDLYIGNTKEKTMVLIANADDVAKTFDIQFINDKSINRHFAGNFSAIGNVTLYLGELYEIWIEAGGNGTYLSRDPDTKTVVMDGSQTLELLDLPLAANAKYPIEIEFSLYPGITIPDFRYDFRLRQFTSFEDGEAPEEHGSMSFQINTRSGADIGRKAPTTDAMAQTNQSAFRIYPNPANDHTVISHIGNEAVEVGIAVYDVVGREMYSSTHETFYNSHKELDLSGYAPGVYLLNITYKNGKEEQLKFVKQ